MNELRHLQEFRQVLDDYHISESSRDILSGTNLVLMVAPSSTGRNTIIRELVKTGHYYFIVSDTTRKPRVNDGILEQTGEHYWFRPEEEVLADLQQGKFLEAAIIHNQQVSGISIRELQRARDQEKVAITDMEIVGVRNIKAANPKAHAIFVLPPSLEEWLRRLKHRGEMPEAERRRRIESAKEEFEAALVEPYYEFVINDSIDHAVGQVESIVSGKSVDSDQRQKHLDLVRTLLDETKAMIGDKASLTDG